MKNKNIIIPIGVLTKEEQKDILSIIKKGTLSIEEMKTINSTLTKKMEMFQAEYKRVDEEYQKVADGHTGDFDYLCSVSSRRAELYQQIESLKKAILKNRKVIEDEENQDHVPTPYELKKLKATANEEKEDRHE